MNWRRWPRRAAMGLIRAYQLTLSHLVFTQCRFTPSCSQYTLEAVERHGALRGSWVGVKRLLRCPPLHPGGDDPAPSDPNPGTPRHPRARAEAHLGGASADSV